MVLGSLHPQRCPDGCVGDEYVAAGGEVLSVDSVTWLRTRVSGIRVPPGAIKLIGYQINKLSRFRNPSIDHVGAVSASQDTRLVCIP